MLSKRLLKVASLIEKGKKVADIGTDHAYLPIYLVDQGISAKVVAIEANPGPLKVAEKNINKSGYADKILLRSGDGLTPLRPGEVDIAVLAGMGASNIISILEKSRDVASHLDSIIMQPMTETQDLRLYLQTHCYKLIDEELVYEDGRYYEILVAKPGIGKKYDAIMLEIGPLLIKKKHPLLVGFLEEKISHYKKVLKSLTRSNNKEARLKEKYLQKKIKAIEKVRLCL